MMDRLGSDVVIVRSKDTGKTVLVEKAVWTHATRRLYEPCKVSFATLDIDPYVMPSDSIPVGSTMVDVIDLIHSLETKVGNWSYETFFWKDADSFMDAIRLLATPVDTTSENHYVTNDDWDNSEKANESTTLTIHAVNQDSGDRSESPSLSRDEDEFYDCLDNFEFLTIDEMQQPVDDNWMFLAPPGSLDVVTPLWPP